MGKKTLSENAIIDFQNCLASYKNITGKTDEELAKDLGCSAQTISNARKNPFKASGYTILMIYEHWLKAENERRIYG